MEREIRFIPLQSIEPFNARSAVPTHRMHGRFEPATRCSSRFASIEGSQRPLVYYQHLHPLRASDPRLDGVAIGY
jgi:hypothetical protein